MAATTTISFEKSTSGIGGTHLSGGIGARNRLQSSLNSSRFRITKRNAFLEGKLLIQGSGGGLVPPKRSGRETAVIFWTRQYRDRQWLPATYDNRVLWRTKPHEESVREGENY